MTPIVPGRIVCGSVLAETTPVDVGLARVHRGVDLGSGFSDVASGPAPGAAATGPYRGRLPEAPALAPVPVLVREINEHVAGEAELEGWFEGVTLDRQRMSGSPAPRLLHTFGRGGRLLASVEEMLSGTPLAALIQRLLATSAYMPASIALAIGQGLLPLWTAAEPWNIHVLVDPQKVLLDGRGRVRVRAAYGEEQARQAVGAAILVLDAMVAYTTPEQVHGARPDARGGMFTLGLLLYEMLAGVHPIASAEPGMFHLLNGIAGRDAPPLRLHRPDIHPAVSAFVHRCLDRDPARRFDSWKELAAAYAGLQALHPPAGPAEVVEYLRSFAPAIPRIEEPPIEGLDGWRALPESGYHAVSLPDSNARAKPLLPARAHDIDPEAVHPGIDGRPMLPVSETILVDARPVTRAEMERFFLVTRAPRPPRFSDPGAADDDDPCTFVPPDVAEAYARWAGKRLPTEAEWNQAVAALGASRLATGAVWEWTASAHESGGRAIRGGRWRDQLTLPGEPRNRSFASSAAPDIGFRCVASRRPGAG
jgi:hypothetical protein